MILMEVGLRLSATKFFLIQDVQMMSPHRQVPMDQLLSLRNYLRLKHQLYLRPKVLPMNQVISLFHRQILLFYPQISQPKCQPVHRLSEMAAVHGDPPVLVQIQLIGAIKIKAAVKMVVKELILIPTPPNLSLVDVARKMGYVTILKMHGVIKTRQIAKLVVVFGRKYWIFADSLRMHSMDIDINCS